MITVLRFIDTPIISYTIFFIVRTFKVYPINNFQAHKTELFIVSC